MVVVFQVAVKDEQQRSSEEIRQSIEEKIADALIKNGFVMSVKIGYRVGGNLKYAKAEISGEELKNDPLFKEYVRLITDAYLHNRKKLREKDDDPKRINAYIKREYSIRGDVYGYGQRLKHEIDRNKQYKYELLFKYYVKKYGVSEEGVPTKLGFVKVTGHMFKHKGVQIDTYSFYVNV